VAGAVGNPEPVAFGSDVQDLPTLDPRLGIRILKPKPKPKPKPASSFLAHR
jgi:hypothetical protein